MASKLIDLRHTSKGGKMLLFLSPSVNICYVVEIPGKEWEGLSVHHPYGGSKLRGNQEQRCKADSNMVSRAQIFTLLREKVEWFSMAPAVVVGGEVLELGRIPLEPNNVEGEK